MELDTSSGDVSVLGESDPERECRNKKYFINRKQSPRLVLFDDDDAVSMLC